MNTSLQPPSLTLWLLDGRQQDDKRLDALVATLGASEQARHARFLRGPRARQFLLGRLLLRHVVHQQLAIPPDQLVITEREGAAPLLSLPGTASETFHFSLSHSHDWIACASSTVAPVGVDIEDRRQPRDLAALAQAAFDAEQLRWWQGLPPARREAAFFRLWNCAEAQYKLGNQAQAPGLHCQVVEHAQLAIGICTAGEPPAPLRVIALDLQRSMNDIADMLLSSRTTYSTDAPVNDRVTASTRSTIGN